MLSNLLSARVRAALGEEGLTEPLATVTLVPKGVPDTWSLLRSLFPRTPYSEPAWFSLLYGSNLPNDSIPLTYLAVMPDDSNITVIGLIHSELWSAMAALLPVMDEIPIEKRWVVIRYSERVGRGSAHMAPEVLDSLLLLAQAGLVWSDPDIVSRTSIL